MTCLYIVRHAIAGERDPVAWPDDGLRPLTRKGTRKFKRAARGLATLVPEVELVLASPKVRAWRTAEILAEQAGWPAPVVCEAFGGDSIAAMIAEIKMHAGRESLAIVGHEPSLSLLVSALIADDTRSRLELRKGAVACLSIDDLSVPGPSVLEWLLPPRVLRALGRGQKRHHAHS